MSEVRKCRCGVGRGGAAESGRLRIYLAGAYTSIASSNVDGAGRSSDTVNGVISTLSPWRQLLEETERALESRGWSVFLPHREVSRWGSRDIAPAGVAMECLTAVASSDAVIAILGESFGTHVEVGMALGCGIPTVIVRSSGCNESYFGLGVAASNLVSALVLTEVTDLPLAIYNGRFQFAYQRAAVNAWMPTRT